VPDRYRIEETIVPDEYMVVDHSDSSVANIVHVGSWESCQEWLSDHA
jgi:hypothetical protein